MESPESETESGPTERKRSWARVMPYAATSLLLLVLLGVGTTSAHSVPPSAAPASDYVLANVPEVTALAATDNAVFATSGLNCSQVWIVSPDGTISLYAEVPVSATNCGEGALVVAPAPSTDQGNGWGSNDYSHGAWGDGGQGGGFVLYYAVESHLFAISNFGSTVATVATFKIAGDLDLSVTYDQVGTWNHDVIVVGQGGTIWLVNPSTDGVTTLLSLKTHSEGPAVAPMSFGSYGGDLLVAEQKSSSVVAISPTGTISTVTSMKKAEDVLFPTGNTNPCQKSPTGVLLVANYANGTIEAFNASALQLPENVGIVDGEFNAGIAAFTASGASTTIAGGSPDLEQMAWASFFCHQDKGCGGGNGCGHCGNGGNCGHGGNGCGQGNCGRGNDCKHGHSGGQGW